jgi:hypothetical protein
MQALTIKKDGTTTIEFTDDEAHALRDDLHRLAAEKHLGGARSETAWKLARLLAHGHGEPGEV